MSVTATSPQAPLWIGLSERGPALPTPVPTPDCHETAAPAPGLPVFCSSPSQDGAGLLSLGNCKP
ncbi:hypothetical protein LEMLEM_LOCUS4298, partial [Lemmus lemmus]